MSSASGLTIVVLVVALCLAIEGSGWWVAPAVAAFLNELLILWAASSENA